MTKRTNDERGELLEIYKLHAELADRVSQRRESANRLYVSILTGLFVAIIALARWSGEYPTIMTPSELLIVAGMLGMGISASWYIVIRSYRQLNSGKFATLHALEKELAYPFFSREWELLEQGKNFKKYWKLTIAETILALIAGLAYLGMFAYGLIS